MSRGRIRRVWTAVRRSALVAVGATALVALSAPVAGGSGGSVGSASLSVSSTAATATKVTYSVTFVATDGLVADTSKITLIAAAGTTFAPTAGCSPYVVADNTTGAADGCLTATVVGGNQVQITAGVGAAAGDIYTVTANAVTNPSTSGAKTLQVATTDDPTAVSLAYTLTAATAVVGAHLQVSSTSVGATKVTYSATFTATNGLTGGYSTVTFTGPTGTTFAPTSGCGPYAVVDNTSGAGNGCITATVVGGKQVVVTMPVGAARGDSVTVIANAVTNTSTVGKKTVGVSTSSDPKPVSLPVTTTATTAVTSQQLELTSTSSQATMVTYTVSFTATNGLTAGYSTITLSASGAGTVFRPTSGCSPYVVRDDVTGAVNGCVTATVVGSNKVVITTPVNVSRGDAVTVTANGVTSPSAAGKQKVSVSTSSDPKPVTAQAVLTAPTAIVARSLRLSSTLHSATGVTYTVTFTSTNGLAAQFSTMTLTGPIGTVFAPTSGCGPYVVLDVTTGAVNSCLTASVVGGNKVVITTPVNVSRGDTVTVTAGSVTNSSSTGPQTLSGSTSSDPVAASFPFTLT